MQKPNLSRYAPLGMSLKAELGLFCAGMSYSVIFSLLFLVHYMDARSDLFVWHLDERKLLEGAVMPDFVTLLDDEFHGFLIVGLGMLLFAVYHYFYHYQESKSVYLMRRLPDKWEWHRRCLTLPLAAIVICLLTALVLFFLFFGVYMICTPQECLAPGQWQKLWRGGV